MPPSQPLARDYQSRALQNSRSLIASGKRRLLVVSPTGSGKMFLIANIMHMAAEKGRRAGFLAHTRELVEQCRQQLMQWGVCPRIYMAGTEEEYWSSDNHLHSEQAWIGSKDTLWSRAFRRRGSLAHDPPDADILIFDEAHLSAANTWKRIADHYDTAVQMGFTATPCRGDGRGLGSLYDAMLNVASYQELQQGGYLVPVRVWNPNQPDLTGVKISGGDYQRQQLQERMDKPKLVGSIVPNWLEINKQLSRNNPSTIVFAAGIEHSLHVRDEFRAAGIAAEHLDGRTPTPVRDLLIERLRNGEVTVLCNYGVATTGVDVPRLKHMICARPTKSFGLWRQMGGRIQRPFEDYEFAVIQDHTKNTLTYGFPDEDVPWKLDHAWKTQDYVKQRKNPERTCPKCKIVFSEPACPECGFVPRRQPRQVATQKGSLAEIRRRTWRKQPVSEKQRVWKECLQWAARYNKQMRHACGRYKQITGVWPRRPLAPMPHGTREQHALARVFLEKANFRF